MEHLGTFDNAIPITQMAAIYAFLREYGPIRRYCNCPRCLVDGVLEKPPEKPTPTEDV